MEKTICTRYIDKDLNIYSLHTIKCKQTNQRVKYLKLNKKQTHDFYNEKIYYYNKQSIAKLIYPDYKKIIKNNVGTLNDRIDNMIKVISAGFHHKIYFIIMDMIDLNPYGCINRTECFHEYVFKILKENKLDSSYVTISIKYIEKEDKNDLPKYLRRIEKNPNYEEKSLEEILG